MIGLMFDVFSSFVGSVGTLYTQCLGRPNCFLNPFMDAERSSKMIGVRRSTPLS